MKLALNSQKLFYILCAVLVFLLMATIGLAYLGNTMLVNKAAQLKDLKLEDSVLSQQQINIAQAKKDIAKYADLAQIANTVVPKDKDQARTVQEIVRIAAQSNVQIGSISFPSSSLGAGATGGTNASGGTGGASGGTSRPAAGNSALSQLTPVPGLSNIYNLQITVQSEGNSQVLYDNFIRFLQRLENNRRTAHVSNITLQPLPDNPNYISFVLTLEEYVKP